MALCISHVRVPERVTKAAGPPTDPGLLEYLTSLAVPSTQVAKMSQIVLTNYCVSPKVQRKNSPDRTTPCRDLKAEVKRF